jgi:hypothetical protein
MQRAERWVLQPVQLYVMLISADAVRVTAQHLYLWAVAYSTVVCAFTSVCIHY